MSDRTVLDATLKDSGLAHRRAEVVSLLTALGIDPETPFDRFARWVRWGQRVDETEPLTYRPEDRQNVPAAVAAYRRGWNACLDHIKEQP